MVPRSLRKGQKGSEKKKEDPEIKEVEMERTEMVQESVDWASLTVSKLKDVCKELGLLVGGRKADIIKRIEDHKIAQNAATKKDVASVENSGETTTTDKHTKEDSGDGDGIEWSEIAEMEPEAQKGEENEKVEDDEPTDSRTTPNTVEEVVTPDEAAKMPEEEAEEVHSIVKSINSQSTDEEDNAEDNRSEAEAEVEALLGGGSDDEQHNDVVESRKRTFDDQNEDDALEEDFESAPPKKQAKEFLENGSCSPTSVKIDNFVRPFTLTQARDLVEQATGENGLELNEKTFFMNKIKTYAIATLPSKECVDKVIDALEGLQWPERSVKRLNVTMSNVSALEAAAEMSRHDVVKALEVIGRLPRRIGSSDGISKSSAAAFQREGGERVIEREVEPGVVEREAQSQVAEQGPDKLFQKTTALPPLYWIPLSEEDVSLKRVRIELEKAKASKKHGGHDDTDRSIEGRGKRNSSDRSQDRERARSNSISTDGRSKDRSRDGGKDQRMDYSRDRSRDRSISRSLSRSRSRGSNRSWRRSRLRSHSRDRGGYNRGDSHRRRGYSPDRFMNRRRGGDARRHDICYGWEAGNCRFGSNCRFYHDGSRRDGGRSPSRRGGGMPRQPCRDYGRGNCRYGEDCRYLH